MIAHTPADAQVQAKSSSLFGIEGFKGFGVGGGGGGGAPAGGGGAGFFSSGRRITCRLVRPSTSTRR